MEGTEVPVHPYAMGRSPFDVKIRTVEVAEDLQQPIEFTGGEGFRTLRCPAALLGRTAVFFVHPRYFGTCGAGL